MPSTIQQPIFPSSSTFRIPFLYPVSPSSPFAVRGACLEQQSNAEKFLTRTRMSRTLNTHIAISPDLHFTMGHYRRLIIKDRLFSWPNPSLPLTNEIILSVRLNFPHSYDRRLKRVTAIIRYLSFVIRPHKLSLHTQSTSYVNVENGISSGGKEEKPMGLMRLLHY